MQKNDIRKLGSSFSAFLVQKPAPVLPVPHKKSDIQSQEYNGLTWVDVENPDNAAFNALADQYGLQQLHTDTHLLKGQLPRIEHEKDYIFLLLQIPHYEVSDDRILTHPIGIFLGKDFLVTVHEGHRTIIRKLFHSCQRQPEVRDQFFKKSAGFLFYNVVNSLLEEVVKLEQAVLQELDEIEDRVFDNSRSDAYQIGRLRQKIVKLTRVTSALKVVLSDVEDEKMAKYYSLNSNTATRLWETMEEARETIEIYKDADFTLSTEKTNQILAILTLLFTLTIPATIFGTFYGMNILLPGGLEAGSWSFLGSYTTLKIVAVGSTLPALLMFMYFRAKKWF